MQHILETFAATNCPVLIKDSDGVPLRIYAPTGALLDSTGNASTDATGLLSVWVNSETQPVITLLTVSRKVIESGSPRLAEREEVTIGEIRYFASPPADPAWLKCDGAAYLRTDYPEYEGLRPKSAFKHTVVYQASSYAGPGGASCWTGQYFISCGVAFNDRSLYRSTDLVNWTPVSEALQAGYGGPVHHLYAFGTTGRVLAFDRTNGKCVVSVDHGATWNTADNITLPTTTPLPGVIPSWTAPTRMSSGGVLSFFLGADIAASSTDGITWSKIQLPFHGQWECVHDKYPSDSDIYAADTSTPGRYVEIYGNVYAGQGVSMPQVGFFNDWSGSTNALGAGHYVCMSQMQKQIFLATTDGTYMAQQIMYDAAIDVGQLGGVTSIDGRFIARSKGDLFIFDPSNREAEYVKDFFGVASIGTYKAMCAVKDGVLYMFVAGNPPEITSITLDPLKFNAPGLAPKAGAIPYVYTAG